MKSVQNRIKEFVNYHINGDGECNNTVLKEYADEHCLTAQDRFDLAYFFSITYCVCSATILLNDRHLIKSNPLKYARANKQHLIFQSDRKYVKMLNNFANTLKFWVDNLQDYKSQLGRMTDSGRLSLKKAIPYVQKWVFFGRFSAFLFLETLACLMRCEVENYTIDWKNGSTATSGLMNVYGLDKYANEFDKKKKLDVPVEQMDNMLFSLAEKIKKEGGNDDTTQVETSLCAYRKFYKGSRYNGFYLDRMLGEIYHYINQKKYKSTAEEILKLRAKLFPKKYLGELSGWNNIRPQMKKAYLLTGEIF